MQPTRKLVQVYGKVKVDINVGEGKGNKIRTKVLKHAKRHRDIQQLIHKIVPFL